LIIGLAYAKGEKEKEQNGNEQVELSGVQIFQTLPVYKTSGKDPRLKHKGYKTSEKSRIYRKVVAYGLTKKNPERKIL